jgi:large subunit ribosomal protein L35
MPKPGTFKPKKSVLKRMKLTAKGKVKRKSANKSHLMSGRSAKRSRNGRKSVICPPVEQRRVRQMLGLQ